MQGQKVKIALKITSNTLFQLYMFLGKIRQQRHLFANDLMKIIQLIENSILQISNKKIKLLNLLSRNEYCFRDECLLDELQALNYKVIQELNEWLKEEQKFRNVDDLIRVLNEDKDISPTDNQKSFANFYYKKIVGLSINFGEYHQFGFNKSDSILFFGYQSGIIEVYKFNNHPKLIKTLKKHISKIKTLIGMKQSDMLLSVSENDQLILWNNEWSPKQLSKFKTKVAIINNDQDLIISGDADKTIRFWKNINNFWRCQQKIQVGHEVYSINLSPSQKQLISCDYLCQIKIFEHQYNQWSIVQTLQTNFQGYHLCFIRDNQFLFQPFADGILEIYNYESETRQFIIRKSDVRSKGLNYDFPCNFINEMNILIIKKNQNIYFFDLDLNGELSLQQSLKFEKNWSSGRFTDTGQFLVISTNLKQIQISKLINLH